MDQSIDLDPSARMSWLSDIAHAEPVLAGILAEMFTADGYERAGEFLQTRDFLERRLEAVLAKPSLIGKRFGAYRVLSLLGHGGMGSVWLADRVDGLFARQVALKLIHPALFGHAALERLAGSGKSWPGSIIRTLRACWMRGSPKIPSHTWLSSTWMECP